ncbi:PREDICTED: cyclin-G2-like isoform X1 [Thamnophis sirtalis]|uniref:Cyclin-G2-like isoform X1 n=1 Tax=Thamnophis sirtalis TaxID=35019 RepID=A0A6I9YZQ9_9SAUR|nr:PREDICTED: cyclin-G2-like isoform X1 [Thamnophis sirtalis]
MKNIEVEEQMSSWLFKQLKLHLDQERKYQPREKGLSLIECTTENENTLCPRLRNAKVEDLWSLVNFFGFATETFVLAVNILDRFLALMKVFRRKEMLHHSLHSFILGRQINSHYYLFWI